MYQLCTNFSYHRGEHCSGSSTQIMIYLFSEDLLYTYHQEKNVISFELSNLYSSKQVENPH